MICLLTQAPRASRGWRGIVIGFALVVVVAGGWSRAAAGEFVPLIGLNNSSLGGEREQGSVAGVRYASDLSGRFEARWLGGFEYLRRENAGGMMHYDSGTGVTTQLGRGRVALEHLHLYIGVGPRFTVGAICISPYLVGGVSFLLSYDYVLESGNTIPGTRELYASSMIEGGFGIAADWHSIVLEVRSEYGGTDLRRHDKRVGGGGLITFTEVYERSQTTIIAVGYSLGF